MCACGCGLCFVACLFLVCRSDFRVVLCFRPFVCVFVCMIAFTPASYFIYYALCFSRRPLVRFVCLAFRLYISLRLVCCRPSVWFCVFVYMFCFGVGLRLCFVAACNPCFLICSPFLKSNYSIPAGTPTLNQR